MPDQEPLGSKQEGVIDSSSQGPLDVVSDFRNTFKTVELFAHTPRDGSPDIFKSSVTQWTKDDFENGIRSSQDKLNHVVRLVMGDLWPTNENSDAEIDSQLNEKIYRFAIHKPLFIPVDRQDMNEDILSAASNFGTDQAGMVVKLGEGLMWNTANVLTFPAVSKDGVNYRVLQAIAREEIETVQRAFDYLSLPTVVQRLGDKLMAFVEFVEGAEHPVSITQAELDDWLARVESSSVDFGFDVGKEETVLDNMVRYNGKLLWCDGDLIAARAIPQEETLRVVSSHRNALQRLVKN